MWSSHLVLFPSSLYLFLSALGHFCRHSYSAAVSEQLFENLWQAVHMAGIWGYGHLPFGGHVQAIVCITFTVGGACYVNQLNLERLCWWLYLATVCLECITSSEDGRFQTASPVLHMLSSFQYHRGDCLGCKPGMLSVWCSQAAGHYLILFCIVWT